MGFSKGTRGVERLEWHFDKQNTQLDNFYVLKKIPYNQPVVSYKINSLCHLRNIIRADRKWNKTRPIDLLFGVSYHYLWLEK